MPNAETTTDIVTSTTKAIKEGTEAADDYRKSLENLESPSTTIYKIFDRLKISSDELKDGLTSSGSAFEKLQSIAVNYPQIMAAVSLATQGASKAFGQLTNELTDVTGFETYQARHAQIKDAISKLGEKDAPGIAKAMGSESADKLQQAADKANINIKAFALNTLDASNNQKLFNETLFKTAATTGQLDVLNNQIKTYGSLDAVGAQYIEKLKQIQLNTGLTTSESEKYLNNIMKIPGALDLVATTTATGSNMIKGFGEALITLSQGAGVPVEKLVAQTQELRDSFNLITTGPGSEGAGDKVLTFLASTAKAANQLGLDSQTLRSHITNLASSFKLYGDNSQGLVENMYKVAKGLEATGLSAKSSAELAEGYIQNFKNLSLAQKAYLSEQSGGPGGLQGAFDIDALLREGKFDEVAKKVKETLKSQMGGELISVQEARQSPEAAAQFAKQITLLQQGPLGGFAKSNDAAERLLEGMKAEDEGKVGALDDSSKSLKDYFEGGKSKQDENNTLISRSNDALDAIKLDTQIVALASTKYLSGTASPGVTSLFGNVDSISAEAKELKAKLRDLDRRDPVSMKEDPGTARSRGAIASTGAIGSVAGAAMDYLEAYTKDFAEGVKKGTIDPQKKLKELDAQKEQALAEAKKLREPGGNVIAAVSKEAETARIAYAEDAIKKVMAASKPDVKSPAGVSAAKGAAKSPQDTGGHPHGGIPFFCTKCQKTILEDLSRLLGVDPNVNAANSTSN
jgi:hypothetical protein